MAQQIQFRRGTAAQATAANPILAEGEMAIETDTGKFKIGDGVTAWNSLAYGGLSGAAGASGTSTNSTAPNATVPVVYTNTTNAATNVDVALNPKGTGSVLSQIPDSLTTGGNKRGASAVDLQLARTANTQVASGTSSTIGGGKNNTSSNTASTVTGGTGCSATDTNTTAGGNGSTASNTSSVAFGEATANGFKAVALGTSTASGTVSAAIGNNNTSSGAGSFSCNASNTADGIMSFASGEFAKTFSLYGRKSHSSGNHASAGDAQTSLMIVRASVTDATATVMTAGTTGVNAASTTNQFILQNQNAVAFTGLIVAKKSGLATSSDVSAWKVEGLIARGANAASTVLIASTVTAISNTPAWTFALAADTTNGGLKATFTGAAATSVRATFVIDSTAEVIY